MDEDCTQTLAEEVPVAFRYGGVAHAVMMATPADLEDFALGFSLTEGVIARPSDIRAMSHAPEEDGIAIDVTLAPDRLRAYLARHRTRSLRAHTSCGVCGVQDLADLAADRVEPVAGRAPEADAVRRALADLRDNQPLARATRATHAAAWADGAGRLRLVREDVGRHNALDKLIGAVLRAGETTAGGFCLVTSRCSFEMVQKSVAARFPALVSISAATALAVRTAGAAGLALVPSAGRMRQPA